LYPILSENVIPAQQGVTAQAPRKDCQSRELAALAARIKTKVFVGAGSRAGMSFAPAADIFDVWPQGRRPLADPQLYQDLIKGRKKMPLTGCQQQ
jgi:hypothetical protein